MLTILWGHFNSGVFSIYNSYIQFSKCNLYVKWWWQALPVTGEIHPYTNSDGTATTRQGKDWIPITGSLCQRMINRISKFNYTRETLPGD